MNELTIDKKIESGIGALQKRAQDVNIQDPKDMDEAGAIVKEVFDLQNTIELQRLQFTKPLNESLKNINSFFKKFSSPLSEVNETVREKILGFDKAHPELMLQAYGFIHFVTRHKVTVVDEAKVPREYLMVDMAKVKLAVALKKQIPGIEVLDERGVSL